MGCAGTGRGARFFENPVTVLVWVDLWVGLGLVAALIGNVWDFVSPLNGRALRRAGARARRAGAVEYPERLGRWPAVGLLLVWCWTELVWAAAKGPQKLVVIRLPYMLATLIGTVFWGAEGWLANGEMFTVFARTFARCAPLELTPRNPDVWLATPGGGRELRLPFYAAGCGGETPLPAGAGAFVVAAPRHRRLRRLLADGPLQRPEALVLSIMHRAWPGGRHAVKTRRS